MKLNINEMNLDKNKEYVVGLDYDGVITKRGSSGENEEKWLKRENNFFWRKILNIVSTIYNKFFSLNEEVIELTRVLKILGIKIIIISSHTLTTTHYKESFQTRTRVKNRLLKYNILHDEIIFVEGDKVDICKELGVDLMIEDNLDKVSALRNAGIPSIAKKTDKNYQFLENEIDYVSNLLELIPIIIEEIYNETILKNITTKINKFAIDHQYNQDYLNEPTKQPIFATFTEQVDDPGLIYNEINEAMTITEEKPYTLTKKYK